MKSPHRIASRRSSALVITLAFIVLLTAVMLLFLSQALSYRNWGNSNFNDFKSNAIGQSALEVVVGDLRQEIANGSTNYTFGSGTNTSYLYIPTTNLYAVPQRSGTNYVAGVDQTPNLTRISGYTNDVSFPAVGSRASNVLSTTPALGGQYVALARWNKHYLLPRSSSASTTSPDTTPTSNFTPPSWVYVTNLGPDPLTSPTQDTAGKSVTVIGRYAYAIYDEGGLIDVNVAGTPSNTATNSTTFPTNPNSDLVWGSGLKGAEAFADLTMTNSAGNPILTQAQIDQLVAWRNNATISATGTFLAYTLPTTAPVVYHDYMVAATNGFLTTSGSINTANNNTTDQIFSSRQALIAYAIAAGWSQDSIQYLATFTRDTEQPNYVPPVGRPMVQSSTTVNKYFSGSTGPGFGTGNDAYNVDRVTTAPMTNAPSDINPPFLSVRVTTSFTRADGTTAQVGDPLIKERFPLSRLNLFPLNGAQPSTANAALIYKYFGLTYNSNFGTSPSQPEWYYSHDTGDTAGIDRLTPTGTSTIGVTTQAREPDFFELLKAAINVGSLGKGACYTGWGTAGTEGTLVQARDNLTALQILQIGANIIDQSKTDNFPTSIQFQGDSTVPPNVVRGSEDLPYMYRYRNWVSHYTSTTPMGALFFQPELWDPYSYNSSASTGLGSSGFISKANTPTNFRFRIAQDPSLTAPATPLIFSMGYKSAPTSYQDLSSLVTLNAPLYTAGAPAALTFNAGELNNFWGFREPTLLGVSTMPAKCNLATSAYTDVNTGLNMTGVVVATFPWISAPTATTDTAYQFYIYNNGNSCIRFYLEYQNVGGNWITYDEGPVEPPQTGAAMDLHTIANYTQYNSGTASKEAEANLDWYGATRTDPRTSRWGFFYGEYYYSLPLVDASNNMYGSDWSDGEISFGSHNGGRSDAGFVGTTNSYGKQYRGFQHGYWTENSTRQTYQSDGTSGNALLRYNLDPDGVPRRAMAGYVTDTTEGGTSVSSAQTLTGLPMAIGSGTVNNTYAGTTTPSVSPAYGSRPTILHRPFRSVAELGYAFRDTPWGNINFTFPESGDSPLLDVFCINDTSSTYGLVAGRVNLNSRQAPVLAALFSGSLRDKDDSTTPVLTQAMASDLAKQLVARTTATTVTGTTQGPLMSRADLVGTWMGSTNPTTSGSNLKTAAAAYTCSPDTYYTGFSHDIGTSLVPSINATPNIALIPRQRNAVMRALVDSGTTRTWNLLIDLVAQSGRFSPTATSLTNFTVEGEKHYWLHVAIDRNTGKVIDSQLEVVRE